MGPLSGRRTRRPAIIRLLFGVVFRAKGNAVEFQAVAGQAKPQLLGDPALQFLDFIVVELDHFARLDVDQVVVVLIGSFFIARATIAEIVLGENAGLLEQPHRPVDGGYRNIGIDGDGALVHLLDVGMILGVGQDTGDDPALFGHLQAAFGTQGFELGFGVGHAVRPYTGRLPGYSWRMAKAPDQTIDITGEVCPMTFVRTKLRLERMKPGEILSVRLMGDEPLRNVPRAARDEGHTILGIVADGDVHTVTIKRA